MSAFWLQRQGCDAADLTLVKRLHMERQECCDARRGKMTRQLEAKKVEVALSQRGDAPKFFCKNLRPEGYKKYVTNVNGIVKEYDKSSCK